MYQCRLSERGIRRLAGLPGMLALGLLTACSQQDASTNYTFDVTQQVAVVATTAADYSSGAHAVITYDDTNGYTSLNDLLPTGSDITIAAYGEYFYRIERAFAGNNITKFSVSDPQTPIWQYSTNDQGSSVLSDPHDMVFVNDQKAYVLRYGDSKAWIVNPSAQSEDEFKIGELDLSAYAGADGVPDMDRGVIVGNRLYIALQRLDNFKVTQNAYIAIFDTNTDQEIDANIAGDSLKGVPLQTRNPTSLIYEPDSNSIYIQSSGSFFPVEYTGGIEKLDLDTLTTTVVLDDGDSVDHPYGLISKLAVVDKDVLYFVGYRNFDDNTLYRLDLPTASITQTPVSSLVSSQISYLATDGGGNLWISDAANATVHVIDTQTREQVDAVSTGLNPDRIVFVNQSN
jgi:hypothetical protein